MLYSYNVLNLSNTMPIKKLIYKNARKLNTTQSFNILYAYFAMVT